MKEQPMAPSPFAALDTREKMEQWICWQCRHPKEESKATEIDRPLAAELHQPAATDRQEEKSDPVRQERLVMPRVRHGQYDAVLRRMNEAGKRTKSYIPWTESL